MRKQKPDPQETLRRALKSEYRIGPEWSPWKVPIHASKDELDAAVNRVLSRSGAGENGRLSLGGQMTRIPDEAANGDGE